LNKLPSQKDALLTLTSALVGYIGFTAELRAATLVLAVPVLWTLADSRYAAFAVILSCKLAASRGLLPGAAVFLSESHTLPQAAALYFLMSTGVSLPFLVFWDKDGRLKAIALISAFLVAYVLPPLSLIGIINPLSATGAIFKGWGFAGIFAMMGIYMSCALSRKTAYSFLCVIAMFAVLPPNSWYKPPKAEGIMEVDTFFGRLGSGSFDFELDYERTKMVFENLERRKAGKTDSQIILLPETIAGRLNDTGLELWKDKIQRLFPDKAVIFGAELPTGDGKKYDNAALMIHSGETVWTRQRIPVPYSMYKGPFAKTGANLHLWECGLLPLPDGRKAAVIVCYEAFLTWPLIVSMRQKPDVIICTANLWWCGETSLPVTPRTIVSLWSLTFGVPAVFVRNV
jgi:apolipoprotein N-acyltransferase